MKVEYKYWEKGTIWRMDRFEVEGETLEECDQKALELVDTCEVHPDYDFETYEPEEDYELIRISDNGQDVDVCSHSSIESWKNSVYDMLLEGIKSSGIDFKAIHDIVPAEKILKFKFDNNIELNQWDVESIKALLKL